MVQPAHTAHACRFCRLKRSKCDGQQPCDRCQRWNEICVYDDRTKETKNDLRKERDELLTRDRDANAIFKALQSGDLAEETMASLWSRTPLDQIASKLENLEGSASARRSPGAGAVADAASGTKLDDFKEAFTGNTSVRPTGNSSISSLPPVTGGAPKTSGQDAFSTQSPNLQSSHQTTAPTLSDPSKDPWGLIGIDLPPAMSLLDAFFNWQYLPLFYVNREALENDFLKGEEKNCSKALIRAMICSTCRLSDVYDSSSASHVNLGGRLLQEAAALLNDPNNDTQSLPDAQAHGLMAIHELGSKGRGHAVAHVEACVRMLLALHETSDGELDVSTIAWSSPLSTNLQGSIALARIVHLFISCLKPCPSDHGDSKAKAANWLSPETNEDNEEVLKVLRRPTTIGPIRDEDRFSAILVKLTSSVYCFLSTLSTPVVDYTHDLVTVYHGCLSEYSGLIAALQSLQVSRTSILFIHLVYHFSLLNLCRPFSQISADHDAPIDFRAICLEAAQAILSLSTSYFDIIPARQLPVFVPLFAYAAGLVSYELATNSRPTFKPPSIPHSSSTDSSRDTDVSDSRLDVLSSSTSISSSSLSVPSDPGGKRKIHQISVSPLKPPIPTQAISEVEKAVQCLSFMGNVFPMAPEAEKHLRQLMASSDLSPYGRDVGYGFPLPQT